MKKCLILIMIMLTILSCDKKMEQLEEISNHMEIELLILSDEVEIEIENSDTLNQGIVKSIKLNKDQKAKLLGGLLDKNNYSPTVNRKCKYKPAYAIKVDGEIFATFDSEFCPLLEKYNSTKNEFIQIKTENSIKSIVSEIIQE